MTLALSASVTARMPAIVFGGEHFFKAHMDARSNIHNLAEPAKEGASQRRHAEFVTVALRRQGASAGRAVLAETAPRRP